MKTPLSRRQWLQTAAMAAGTALALPKPRAEAAGERVNILYVFSDEHRYQSMSFTEMPELHTPVMARMASEGFSFSQCVSNYPVCSPHRAMLLTGRWPHQTGVIDNSIPLSAEETTVGKTFRNAGYDTGYIGKWHLGGVRAEPFGFDFSRIWEGSNTHWDNAKCFLPDGSTIQPKGYNATLMTDQAIEFLQTPREKPFFLMLSLNPPHSNFTDAPPEKLALYPKDSLPYRPNVDLEARDDDSIFSKNGYPHYEGYHAHISAVDDELGRLLRVLKENGQDKNTVVLYSSDHGTMHGSHGIGSKRQPYEESLRVPFLLHAPGRIPAGVNSEALLSTTDIMPTLCELAGIAIPESCVGQDFSPYLRREQGPAPTEQFIMHISKLNASNGENHPGPIFRGLRTHEHTYAIAPEGPLYLFNNREDPYQMKNLVDNPAYAGLRKSLAGRLAEYLHKAEDPFELTPLPPVQAG